MERIAAGLKQRDDLVGDLLGDVAGGARGIAPGGQAALAGEALGLSGWARGGEAVARRMSGYSPSMRSEKSSAA